VTTSAEVEATEGMFVDEVGAVRAAAQWLVAAGAAVGAVLIAGVQLGSLGRLAKRPPLLVVGLLAFLAALWLVGWVIRAASRVLVVDRVTVANLLTAQTARQARMRGIDVHSLANEELLVEIFDEVHVNRGWLLPDGCDSLTELYQQFQQARTHGDNEDVEQLRSYLSQVSSFARTEAAKHFYRQLVDGLSGWRGRCLAILIVVLCLALGVPEEASEPRVTGPTPVRVVLSGNSAAFKVAGLTESCRRSSTIDGVAVDGTLLEPVVVFGGNKTCAPARFRVTEALGVAIPLGSR
jgi:hypothetical protein